LSAAATVAVLAAAAATAAARLQQGFFLCWYLFSFIIYIFFEAMYFQLILLCSQSR
jgi:hypothetical protein